MPSDTLSLVEEALSKLAEKLRRNYGPVEVYLFGSFAKGDWLEDSDIDIIVVSEKFRGKPMPERINIVRKQAPENLAFEILVYTPQELEEAEKRSMVIQDATTSWRKIA